MKNKWGNIEVGSKYDPYRPLNMKDLTSIVVILDRSGSMSSIKDATIAGFNEFVSKQRAGEDAAELTLVQFDDEYEVVYKALPIDSVKNLTTETFVPRGWTALNDAIGRTVEELGARIRSTNLKYRPNNVIVVIITDGFENKSKEYSREQVAKMIKQQQDKDNWTFLFIGANQDAIVTGRSYNIPMEQSITFDSHSVLGTHNVFGSTGDLVLNARLGNSISYSSTMRDEALAEDK